MDTLSDSIIICDVSPKQAKRKSPLGIKNSRTSRKKTFYESPLRHIQLSSKRFKRTSAGNNSVKETRSTTKKKTSLSPIADEVLQDSIIVLSDNEGKSDDTKSRGISAKKVKKKKLLQKVTEHKQSSKSVNKSSESLSKNETETCAKKRKRTNSSILLDSNSSCLLISDTDESEIISVDLDDENIAPASGTVNQSSDDIVVVWTSRNPSSLSKNSSEDSDVILEEKDKIFMIDCTPSTENLIYLESTEDPTSSEPEKSIEGIEKRAEKSGEEGEDTEDDYDELDDPNYLPFSKKGLKLPKTHNISKRLNIKKPRTSGKYLHVLRRHMRISSIASALNETSLTAAQSSEPKLVVTESAYPPEQSVGLQIPTIQSQNLEAATGTSSYASTQSSAAGPLRPDEKSMLTSYKPPGHVSSYNYRLREIIIDGNNVAMAYSNNRAFSEEGILLVMTYFQRRGHTVKVFIPQYRRSPYSRFLERLHREGIVVFTPSRFIGGRWITPYDDRFILEYATVTGGIVISQDQYRDLYREKPEWRDTIENRLLAPTFVGNYVMFPEDPLGKYGPRLEQFLRY